MDTQRLKKIRKEFRRDSPFSIGTILEHQRRGDRYEIVDFGYRFQEEEFVYWLLEEDAGRNKEPRCWSRDQLYHLEAVEEPEKDFSEDRVTYRTAKDEPPVEVQERQLDRATREKE